MESKSGVCTPNTYVKSAKNRGEILVPVVSPSGDWWLLNFKLRKLFRINNLVLTYSNLLQITIRKH